MDCYFQNIPFLNQTDERERQHISFKTEVKIIKFCFTLRKFTRMFKDVLRYFLEYCVKQSDQMFFVFKWKKTRVGRKK